MSRSFSRSAQYLTLASAVISGPPLTMSCWFNANTTPQMTLIAVSSSSSAYHRLATANSSVGVQATTNNNNAATTVGFSLNTWNHALGVWSTATSRTAYINGGSSGTNTTSASPTVSETDVGRTFGSAVLFGGQLAEAAIWNVVLDVNAIKALAAGVNPLRVRPDVLVAYWPIWGLHSPEIDLSPNNHALTVTGATLGTTNPPVVPFGPRPRVAFAPWTAAPPAAASPAAMLTHF